MAVSVQFQFERTLDSKHPPQTLLSHILDFEKQLPLQFPGLKAFRNLGHEVYHWEFEPVKVSSYDLKLDLKTQFKNLKNKGIECEPIERSATNRLKARWEVIPTEGGSKLAFRSTVELELGLPFFLKGIADSVAQKELARLFEAYVSNVEKTLA